MTAKTEFNRGVWIWPSSTKFVQKIYFDASDFKLVQIGANIWVPSQVKWNLEQYFACYRNIKINQKQH